MEDELLVGLNDYKILDRKHPVAYTRDISSCIVALIHRKKNSALLHIESYDGSIEIGHFIDLLENQKDNPVMKVEIFKGYHTSSGNLSVIKFILHRLNIDYEEYFVFRNGSNETSVGYNYLTEEHLIARMDKGTPILRVRKPKNK